MGLAISWAAGGPGLGQAADQEVLPAPAGPAAPVVNPAVLAGVEDKAPVRSAEENHYEFTAYNYLLELAHGTPVEAFARSARRDLTFAHFFEEPGKYRGEVVHVEGRLRRLRRFDAPRLAWTSGIRHVYEGWIFDPEIYAANPVCLIFTELPPGWKVEERIDPPLPVAFDGYFFKRYRYKAADTWRDAPLLIGRAPVARPLAEAPEWSVPYSNAFVMTFLLVLAITLGLAVGLGLWYRQSDKRVRARLKVLTAPAFEAQDRNDARPGQGAAPLSETVAGPTGRPQGGGADGESPTPREHP
jgi:hypothetical protein